MKKKIPVVFGDWLVDIIEVKVDELVPPEVIVVVLDMVMAVEPAAEEAEVVSELVALN